MIVEFKDKGYAFTTLLKYKQKYNAKVETTDSIPRSSVKKILAIVKLTDFLPALEGRGFPPRGLIVPTIGSGLHPSFGGQTRGAETPSCLNS